MALYIISYDLIDPGQNYEKVSKGLKKIGAKSVLLSQWAVEVDNTTAEKLFDAIHPLFDGNDKLLVTKVSDWVGIRLMTDLNTL